MYRERHRITRHFNAERQRAKQTLTTSKYLTEVTYGDFPCQRKVNRDKLGLINRPWKCKKGKRLTITAYSFTKNRWTRWIPPTVPVRKRKFRPLQEPIRLRDLLNSARSRAEKMINSVRDLMSVAERRSWNKLKTEKSSSISWFSPEI